MAIPSRQIGWGTEENLLWQISKQMESLTSVTYNSGGTVGPQGPAGPTGPTGPAGSINSTGGNVDTLGGVAMRTLYSRSNVINYSVGTEADLMSGSSNFGSRNFPTQFFTDSVNYVSKTIHFRVTGKWGTVVTPNTSAVITTTFGTSVIATSTNILDFSSNKPSEIFGEITITNGFAIVCYSVGWCDQTGDFRRQPISDPSTPVNISGFTGGDFKVLLGSATNNSFTSYLGYIQVWN
jgi:hypothetical protein